jgi:myo-inositol-1(or 4)-monophosphatase
MTAQGFRRARLPGEVRPLVTEAIHVALGAGDILRRRFRKTVRVTAKGPADIVTSADLEAQGYIVHRLRRFFPGHGILAEEGLNGAAGGNWRWIVDPLDGTKNFARGISSFCVAIAAERDGQVKLGVVYDPMQEELFLGVRGQGAWRNGRPIRVSGVTGLANAFLATGLPNRVRKFPGPVGRTFGRFAARCLGVRDRGSGALDLCYVACGRFDGYWELDQSPWDIAAGSLIVEEAGGRMSDFRGGPFDIHGGETVASNGRIHDQILAVLSLPGARPSRYRPPLPRG